MALRLLGEPAGPVTSVEVLESHASAARTDSLVAALRAGPMPCGGLRPGVFPGDDAKKCLGIVEVVVALDRRGSGLGFAADVRLPSDVRRAFATGPLACWARAWRAADRAFEWEDFVLQSWRALPFPRSHYPQLLPTVATRDSFGMLLHSPDGRWVLDPFQGAEIHPDSQLGYDVDVGTTLYDTATGDRVDHWVQTTAGGHLAAWIRDDAYVRAGSARVHHPKLRDVWLDVPAIWYGDLGAGREWVYHGAPAPALHSFDLHPFLRDCLRAAYPELRFE